MHSTRLDELRARYSGAPAMVHCGATILEGVRGMAIGDNEWESQHGASIAVDPAELGRRMAAEVEAKHAAEKALTSANIEAIEAMRNPQPDPKIHRLQPEPRQHSEPPREGLNVTLSNITRLRSDEPAAPVYERGPTKLTVVPPDDEKES